MSEELKPKTLFVPFDEQREANIVDLCEGVVFSSVQSTGDYRSGGQCPFCKANCCWNDILADVIHQPDCIYLIAKELLREVK